MEKRLLSNEEPFSLGPVVLLMAKSFRYAYPDISGILEDHMADCQQCKEWRITVKVPWTQHKVRAAELCSCGITTEPLKCPQVLTPFTAVQLAVYGNKAIHGDYVSEGCKTHLDPFNVRGGVACIFRLQLDPRETRSGLRCKCKGGAGPYALHLPAATPPIIVTDGDATIILGDFLRRREDQHYVAPWNPHCQAHTPGRTMSVVAYMSKGVCTEGDKILLEANKFKGK